MKQGVLSAWVVCGLLIGISQDASAATFRAKYFVPASEADFIAASNDLAAVEVIKDGAQLKSVRFALPEDLAGAQPLEIRLEATVEGPGKMTTLQTADGKIKAVCKGLNQPSM